MLDGRKGTLTVKYTRYVGDGQIEKGSVHRVDVHGVFQYSDSEGHDSEALILVELETGELVEAAPRELVMDK